MTGQNDFNYGSVEKKKKFKMALFSVAEGPLIEMNE